MKKILLLHGALGASSQFTELAKLLHDDFEILLLDFEGHGNARVNSRAFRIQHFAENVLEYLDEKKIHSIDIFGYSMGGHVALTLASTHPSRIKSVFTLATKFQWDEVTAVREAKFLNPEKILEKVPHFASQLKERHTTDWKLVTEKTGEQMLSMPATNPLTEEVLKNIQCPVRVSVGDKDQMVTLEETVRVYRIIPNCQLQVFPASPHAFEKMKPEIIAKAIKEFLA